MKIRLATREDQEFIHNLYKENAKEIGDFNLFWVWDKYIDGRSKHKYVVIDGCGFMRYGYSNKYNAYVLYEMAVVREAKQKGVGKTFYNHLPKPLLIKCNQTNEIGNKFYEAMGMTKAGVEQNKKGLKKNIWWTT